MEKQYGPKSIRHLFIVAYRPLSFFREVRVPPPDAYECQEGGINEHEYKTCKLKEK